MKVLVPSVLKTNLSFWFKAFHMPRMWEVM